MRIKDKGKIRQEEGEIKRMKNREKEKEIG